jgi:hypothetical protein
VNDLVDAYVRGFEPDVTADGIASLLSQLPSDPAVRLTGITVSQNGHVTTTVFNGDPVDITVEYEVRTETPGLRVYFVLYDAEGTSLLRSFAHAGGDELPLLRRGCYRSRATIPARFLAPVVYRLGVSASIYNVRRCFPDEGIISLHVQDSGYLRYAYAHEGNPGVRIAPVIPWSLEEVARADSHRGPV